MIALEFIDREPCQPCADSSRCDVCDERMCEVAGPEPRACGVTCADCSCSCTACLDSIDDQRMELLCLLEREARAAS